MLHNFSPLNIGVDNYKIWKWHVLSNTYCAINILEKESANGRNFGTEDKPEITLNLNFDVDGVKQTKNINIPLNGSNLNGKILFKYSGIHFFSVCVINQVMLFTLKFSQLRQLYLTYLYFR